MTASFFCGANSFDSGDSPGFVLSGLPFSFEPAVA